MQTEPAVIATTPQPGHYDIDPSRSRVTFATRYLDLTVEIQCNRK